MANKYDGEVSLRLDQTRTLKITIEARCEFETLMGYSIDSVMMRMKDEEYSQSKDGSRIFKRMDQIGFKDLRALLWAALLNEDRELKIGDVGKLMEFATGDSHIVKFATIFGKIVDAWVASQGPLAQKKIREMEVERMEALASEAQNTPPKNGTATVPDPSITDSLVAQTKTLSGNSPLAS